MQRRYNDRWERHLIRNSVNPEFQLSPIPEEELSSPDSGSLPELFVEPAPNRHDDPPEYYEGLERRMTRYYRQLFLESQPSSILEEERSSPDSGSLPELVVEPAPDRHDDPLEYCRQLFLESQPSSIPEEELSSPDSGSLPELIVEPAPNRHDDPPEYYEGLERRMTRYYRQLFLESQPSSILEEERSSPDSGSLPELVVEPAPDRHDDPLEYCRQLFLESQPSSILEEGRSSPDSGSLPELVLEPAPERHDDPPEYYRQLFLESQPSSIPEEERSSPDRSSLPELVVEPAPDRHDDPPEYHRQLFLGAHGSDDDISSDFEVNRNMAVLAWLASCTGSHSESSETDVD